MNPTRSRGRQTHPQTARVFGIATGGEGGGLFVAHLNKLERVLMRPQRLEQAINAIVRQAKNGLHPPINEPFDHQIGNRLCHDTLPSRVILATVYFGWYMSKNRTMHGVLAEGAAHVWVDALLGKLTEEGVYGVRAGLEVAPALVPVSSVTAVRQTAYE